MDGFLIVIAADATILYVPDYVTEYVGLTQLELIGQTMYDVVHGDDYKTVERNLIFDPSGKIYLFHGLMSCDTMCIIVTWS